MLRHCLLAATLSCCSLHAHEFVRGSLESTLDDSYVFDKKGRRGRYQAPTRSELERFRSVVQMMISGDYAEAADLAFPLNYNIRIYHDTGTDSDHVVLAEFPNSDRHGGGSFVLRRPDSGPVAPIVFEAPHPEYDSYTKEESVDLYLECQAQALLIAGAHRHNSPDPSPRGPTWTTSDAAHNVDTFFQVFHEEMAMAFPDTTTISLHAMKPRKPQQDVSVSNGTREDLTGSSYSKKLAAILNEVFQDNRRTSKYIALSHQDAGSEAALPGTTNVQGRFSNGSYDPAFVAVESAPQPERFLHVEQSTKFLKKGRHTVPAMAEAFKRLFQPVYAKRAGGLSSRVAQMIGQRQPLKPAAGRSYAEAMPWQLLRWLEGLKKPKNTAAPDDHDILRAE